MNIVQVKKIKIGEGRPKICVPITGRSREEILLRIKEAKQCQPDLVEWRADWYGQVFDGEKLQEILKLLREGIGELPLLVTFRTRREGGEQEISQEEYETFLKRVMDDGTADLMDVELFMGDELLRSICQTAGNRGIAVVASSHDFGKTPSEEEMIARLCRMQELGAHLLKLAVMPRNAGDVLALLHATWEMNQKYAKQPVITMSMGGTGVISRLSGEVFGSALTFGAAGQASAPGQIGVEKLKEILAILHEGL